MGDYTIGLTGGIGAGKSIVARILRCNGFTVYDCDSEAKHLMVTLDEIKESLKSRLGNDIYRNDGNLDRKKLAGMIFSSVTIRTFVNNVVHSAVKKDIEKRRAAVKGLFFIESAILAGSGISQICDKIWIVTASEKERIKRVSQRDNLSKEEISKRIMAQEKEFELLPSEKSLILNNDSNSPLLMEVLELTHKDNNKQNYTYYVERNFSNYR